ncbi:MAG: hypothetical protein ACR2MK_01180 [Solirubrobacteraceae bacterium]
MVPARLRTALLVGSAIGACAGAAFAGTVSAAPGKPVVTSASNRRAARSDAAKLLRRLRLPVGASVSTTEPAGDGGLLKPLRALVATTARADVHAWWVVPGRPDSLLAYIKAHAPAGAKFYATGSGSGGPSGRTVETLDYSWPAIGGVIGLRELAVSVTSLSSSATGVLAQAESDWIVPRPASERVPAGTHEIDVTSAKLDGPTTASLSVTSAVKVRRIVALIDKMPIVQPGTYSCPGLTNVGARVVRLAFRARVAGKLLARATYVDYPPLTAPSGPCNAIDFSVRGHRRAPLIGGDFVTQAQRVLGVSLTGVG